MGFFRSSILREIGRGLEILDFLGYTTNMIPPGSLTNIAPENIRNPKKKVPSRELTYPKKWDFEDDVPFPKVGYVSSLEGSLPSMHFSGAFC